VVFISTESSQGVVQQAREAGATGWIVKPFDQAQLLSVVSKQVKA
jgi:two-component system chemotaxis response regulator CheY